MDGIHKPEGKAPEVSYQDRLKTFFEVGTSWITSNIQKWTEAIQVKNS